MAKKKVDIWKQKWIDAIKAMDKPNISVEAYDDGLGNIIDKVYSDGFTDGANEGSDPDKVREDMASQKEFERDSMD